MKGIITITLVFYFVFWFFLDLKGQKATIPIAFVLSILLVENSLRCQEFETPLEVKDFSEERSKTKTVETKNRLKEVVNPTNFHLSNPSVLIRQLGPMIL